MESGSFSLLFSPSPELRWIDWKAQDRMLNFLQGKAWDWQLLSVLPPASPGQRLPAPEQCLPAPSTVCSGQAKPFLFRVGTHLLSRALCGTLQSCLSALHVVGYNLALMKTYGLWQG